MGMYEIDKTRKHYVPQMYLRGFSVPDNPTQIYVFDKQRPEMGIEVRSIHDVEVARNAYSAENDKILTKREGVWSQILNTIKKSEVAELNTFLADREGSSNLRAWLARFVVDSALRSRGLRDRVWKATEEMRRTHREEEAAALEDTIRQHPASERELRRVAAILKEITHSDNEQKCAAVTLDPFLRGEEGERRYRWYEEGSWRFCPATECRKFITSDIPSTSLLLGPEPQYRNWMSFTMPLSAELQLIGLCGGARIENGLAPAMSELSEENMDLANLCVLQNAERFIYSSSRRELLRTIDSMHRKPSGMPLDASPNT